MSEYIKYDDAINSIIHHKNLTWCYDARVWAEELLEDAEIVSPDQCDGNTDYEDELIKEREAQTVSWQNEKRTGVKDEGANSAVLEVRE